MKKWLIALIGANLVLGCNTQNDKKFHASQETLKEEADCSHLTVQEQDFAKHLSHLRQKRESPWL